MCIEVVNEKCGEERLLWPEKTACTERLRGRQLRRDLTCKKRGFFQVVSKPFGDGDSVSVCGYVVVFTIPIIIYYYYVFKRRSIKLNYGVGSLKLVHFSLHGSDMVSWFALYVCV